MSEITQVKHTPGPWHVVYGLRAILPNGSARDVPVYYIDTHDRQPGKNCVAGIIPEEPDARLMAAAPKLLAALKEVLASHDDEYKHGGQVYTDRHEIRAAIISAEGDA